MEVRKENYIQAFKNYNNSKTPEALSRVLRCYCLWNGESPYELMDSYKYAFAYHKYVKEHYNEVFNDYEQYLEFNNNIDLFEIEAIVYEYIQNTEKYEDVDPWDIEERMFADAMFAAGLNDDVIADLSKLDKL